MSSYNNYDSKLQTHNLNLMSTVKVTDLKLHLEPSINELSSGMAAKKALQDRTPEEVIEDLIKEVFISGDDSAVLMWANTLTSMKIQQSVRQLMRFIEVLVLFRESVDIGTL